jgi:hypothetical protein
MIPAAIENIKLNKTFFQNSFSQNLYAILALIVLFDITAINIAEVAIVPARSHSFD